MLILLLIISLSLVAGHNKTVCENTCKNTNYRLPDVVIPTHYNLKLIPHIVPYNFTFDGEVSIALHVRSATPDIVFHQKNLVIDYRTAYLTAQEGFFFREPTAHNYNEETEMVTLIFEQEIQPGNYTLFLKFTGTLNAEKVGFYREFYTNDEGEKVWMATTFFESIYARQSFPCMDEPALKATFDIAINHYPNYTVLSNMPVLKRSDVDKSYGKVWTTFQRTPPMSTYLVSYVVSDYVNVSNSDGTINIWCRKSIVSDTEFSHNVIQSALIEVEKYLNSSLPVPKLDNVAVPNVPYIGEENWGITIFRESYLVFNKTTHEEFEKESMVLPIFHEVIHQWLGNSVTHSWWTHSWLKEGFCTYLHFYISDKVFKDWNILENFVPNVLHSSFHHDIERDYSLAKKVLSPSEIRSKGQLINYDKAPSVTRMLAHCMSHEVFRKGLLLYLQRHKFDVVSPEDLWVDFQTVLDESRDAHETFEIKRFMETWIEQPGFPVVKVTNDPENGTVTLEQEALYNVDVQTENNTLDEVNNKKWWIPINFATRNNPNFAHTMPSHWLSPENDSVTLTNVDRDDWIIVNIQQTGFYRVNYDDSNWKLVIDYLKTDDYTKIHALNRAQLLDDAYFMMMSQRLHPIRFMELTEYLKQENHLIPWTVLHTIFNTIDGMKLLQIEGMKPYLQTLYDNIIEKLGFDDRPGDDYLTRKTRHEMKQRDCYYDHPQCFENAHERLLALLENKQSDSIPPDLLLLTIEYGLRNANETTWWKVVNMCKNKSTTAKLLVGCIDDLAVIKMFLNSSYSEESSLPPEYSPGFAVDSILYCRPERIDVIVDYVTENWQKMIPRMKNPVSFIRSLQTYIKPELSERHEPEVIEKLTQFLRSTGASYSQSSEEPQTVNERLQSIVRVIEQWLKNRSSATNGNVGKDVSA